MAIKEKIKNLPDAPGVYIMKSAKGSILYVGKATSLKKRVASYFNSKLLGKNRMLIEKVKDIDYLRCESPQQALILEAALIKEKKPKYNISLKDSKSYPYIEITKEKYPRVFISRPKNKKNSYYFGPYTDTGSLKKALKLIRKIFPFCSCHSKKKKKSLCLYYYLGLCPGPCAQKITAVSYNENIKAIKKILKGKRPELISVYKKKMEKLSSLERFERASKIRDKIYAIENIYKGKPRLHELLVLKRSLGLTRLPLLIEAIDISALGKNDATGSVVVFRDATADKSSYRRFLIKDVESIDDYKRIQEVVLRRYSRLRREKKQLPDLILIDGGKGQVTAGEEVLNGLGLNISLIGLAKRNEEVWLPDKNKPKVFNKDNPGLQLLQRIRDEAHRFAHAYHLIRRKKRYKK
ncbi:MAG: GIY-YIG nuclease family protein [Candidatus Omnitrophica bacterium]|nr:GIY-YIG nuclease family protein [Candidatus Omnitrophota bacterium]MCF7893943.1 GIY-YIG nuclease family protein [Candidatus Omnitrophota bacterium]